MKLNKTYHTLRLILGDQLNEQHNWFSKVDDNVLYVIMELQQEQDYVKHHIQKIGAFFLAMRSFGELIKSTGNHLAYFKITSEESQKTLTENILDLVNTYQIQQFEYQSPDEVRLVNQLNKIEHDLQISSKEYDTEHFYTSRTELNTFFEGKKTLILESFYRYLRKKHQLLVDKNNNPEGGKWNYDKENRNKIPKQHQIASLQVCRNNVEDINNEIDQQNISYFGTKKKYIEWPVTRKQSIDILDDFLVNGLPFFGMFQDAMTIKSWRIYHSLLSFSMNVKLISPKEIIEKAIDQYYNDEHNITLPQIEGFVRQILGWREYMRGIYWMKMPDYKSMNFLELKENLPSFYWTGKTNMNCLKHSINQSLNYAYAHHIQRLMVLGNFALLNGTDPDEVDEWYLGVYADAIEWVQLTNTRGMSQFSDGGIVGTKPYVSSANYINKMSDYCSSCKYNYKKNHGEDACPFNSLYWNFIDQHKEKLQPNRRMSMMYAVWNKKSPEERTNTLEQAQEYLNNVNNL